MVKLFHSLAQALSENHSLNRKSFTISKGNWNITDIVWKIREVVSWPGGSKLPSQQPKGGSYLT